MRVLVTGGAGFIGSSLVNALIASGHDVVVVDDMSTGRREQVHPAAGFHLLDVRDPRLFELVADEAPSVVVHLSAQTSVSASLADPAHDRSVNLDGTRAVAEASLRAGVSRLLFASSAAVYGLPVFVPLAEDASTVPENPYGASKLAAEEALTAILADTKVDHASLRFSNVYGPRQGAEGEGGVVSRFLTAMLAGERPRLHGDGSQTRDFVFVADVVLAILSALACEKPLGGGSYNVATGIETSIEGLLTQARMVTGYLGPVGSAPLPQGDVPRSVLDPGKAEAAFGFRARVDIPTGLKRTAAWYGPTR